MLAGCFSILSAGLAPANTLTVGSPLTGTFKPTPIGGPGTFTFRTLNDAAALLASPVSGTVISWRFTGGVGGPFRLRVLRGGADNVFTGAGTRAPVLPAGTGVTGPVPVRLPIAAGDTIAIDNSSFNDKLGTSFPGPSATFFALYPQLADGASRQGTVGAGELGFQATVRYCLVPDLIGEKLAAARARLRANDCALGAVKRPRAKARRRPKFIVSQSAAFPGAISDTVSIGLRIGKKPRHRTVVAG